MRPNDGCTSSLPLQVLGLPEINSGESYGSPAGIRCTEQLHAEMVKRGYSKKPCAFGRSRGGLWASAWAIAHPELCAGIAGIYPVYDWRTCPGADKAAAAYGLSQEQLVSKVDELCPIERMTVAAKAGIPVFIIHGDADTKVTMPIRPSCSPAMGRGRSPRERSEAHV